MESAQYILKQWENLAQKGWFFFNSFTTGNDYNFGAQWPNGRGVLLPTNKTFQGIWITQDLIYINEKRFLLVSSINSSQTDKALPVKTSKPNFLTFFVYFGNSLFVTASSREAILLVTYAWLASLSRKSWRWISVQHWISGGWVVN